MGDVRRTFPDELARPVVVVGALYAHLKNEEVVIASISFVDGKIYTKWIKI